MHRTEKNHKQIAKPVIVALIVASVWLVKSPVAFAQKRGPITEITIEEMSGWFAFSEKYVLTKDGLATAVVPNELNEGPRIKTYRGTFSGFKDLASIVEAKGFFNLKDEYTAEDYDAGTVIISVVRNGKRKTVSDYGLAAPLSFLRLKDLIRSQVKQIKWHEATVQPSR